MEPNARITRPAPDCAAAISAKHLPAPILDTAPRLACESVQIMRNTAPIEHTNIKHFPTSKEKEEALNIIRWTYAVAHIAGDSPRFAFYVSRWRVPEKIARAITEGTFDTLTANCPPIDPAWVRFVPAALEAYRLFIAPRQAKAERSIYSGKKTLRA